MIEFCNVSFRYPYDDFDVASDLSFSLTDGLNTVLCDVQSGKGTLCKLICGQLLPTAGRIYFDKTDASGIAAEQRGILYLSGNPVFFLNKTVAENIAYPLAVRKAGKAERTQAVNDVARRLGLTALLSKKVGKLSLEERKLVAIARGLTVRRKVVLYDDFFDFGSLQTNDFLSLGFVTKLFEDATQVILTADKRLLTGKSVVLDGGKCVFCGDAKQAVAFAESLSFLFDKLDDATIFK